MELNAQQIEEILPHRYPFLLVDRITECEPGQKAAGIKCVSVNEPYFCGHFPGQIRVLTEIFKISSAKRVSLNIRSRA